MPIADLNDAKWTDVQADDLGTPGYVAARMRERRRYVPLTSPAKAAVLGLLLPGAGHVYVSEYGRATVFLASGLIVALSVLTAPLVGVFAAPVLAVSGYDAYAGARDQRQETRARSLTAAYAVLGISLAALASALATPDGFGSPSWAERTLKPDIENALQSKQRDGRIRVASLSCRSDGELTGTCVADVRDAQGKTTVLSVTYTVDADTHFVHWRGRPLPRDI